jgi:predicted porin
MFSMKKTLIAFAAVAAATGAMAQATISGGINVGILDTGAAGAKAAVSSLGGGANAVNIATTEDLGGGLRAGFTGQIRFNASTGDMNSSGTGQAQFHAANVFVGGSLGTARIGKIAEASNCAYDPWGCTGGAALMGGTGLSSLIAAGTQASSVSYASPTIAGFSVGLQTSVSTRQNERQVFNINYANGPFTAQFLRSNSSANAAPNGTAITDVDGSGQSIAASYNFGIASAHFVNAVTKNAAGAKTANLTSLGLVVPMDSITILAGYIKAKTGGTYTATAANDTKLSVGVNYALSKRTTVGADLFKAEAVGSSTGYALRVRHTF